MTREQWIDLLRLHVKIYERGAADQRRLGQHTGASFDQKAKALEIAARFEHLAQHAQATVKELECIYSSFGKA